MPTFFAFIEFDNKEYAQRVFIVHVDNQLSLQILKRLHEVEQGDESKKLNKKLKTISYGEEHLLDEVNGGSLKSTLLKYIGNDYSKYVNNKSKFLETSGFEDGAFNVTFTTEGEEGTQKLINMSLGLKEQVEVTSILGTCSRFGIKAKKPFLELSTGMLSMPEVKPTYKGTLRIKENKFSCGFSFKANLYISPFHHHTEVPLRKSRIETRCFDFIINFHTGVASYNFTISGYDRIDAKEFYNSLSIMNLMGSKKALNVEFIDENKKKLKFRINEKEGYVDHSLQSLMDKVLSLSSFFNINENVNISPNEALNYQDAIERLSDAITLKPEKFKVDFSYCGGNEITSKECACIFFLSARIGDHFVGFYMTIIGPAMKDSTEKHVVTGRKKIIEEKVSLHEGDVIEKECLQELLSELRMKYSDRYNVITVEDTK